MSLYTAFPQQHMSGDGGVPSKHVGGVQNLASCTSGLFRNSLRVVWELQI